MFRLDENMVIDATMTGGPARYINHCCDPNCFTEVIPTEKGNKIVIIAKRKILSGEEVRMFPQLYIVCLLMLLICYLFLLFIFTKT